MQCAPFDVIFREIGKIQLLRRELRFNNAAGFYGPDRGGCGDRHFIQAIVAGCDQSAACRVRPQTLGQQLRGARIAGPDELPLDVCRIAKRPKIIEEGLLPVGFANGAGSPRPG